MKKTLYFYLYCIFINKELIRYMKTELSAIVLKFVLIWLVGWPINISNLLRSFMKVRSSPIQTTIEGAIHFTKTMPLSDNNLKLPIEALISAKCHWKASNSCLGGKNHPYPSALTKLGVISEPFFFSVFFRIFFNKSFKGFKLCAMAKQMRGAENVGEVLYSLLLLDINVDQSDFSFK